MIIEMRTIEQMAQVTTIDQEIKTRMVYHILSYTSSIFMKMTGQVIKVSMMVFSLARWTFSTSPAVLANPIISRPKMLWWVGECLTWMGTISTLGALVTYLEMHGHNKNRY